MAIDLNARRRALEEHFFHREKARALEQHKGEVEKRATREALSAASGVTNQAVLDHLVEIGISVDTMIAIALIPLIEVAWSDQEMQDKERDAILRAAEQEGVEAKSANFELLKKWLKRKPAVELLDAWVGYIKGLDEVLTDDERESLRKQVMGRARQVAEVAGGFIGVAKISMAEEKMLKKLSAAFDK